MKALFLAGIQQANLEPLTDGVPKAMVPIMNRPLLERSITNLRQWGIDEIVIGASLELRSIEEYFGNGRQFGLEIKYIFDDPSNGIGGILRGAAGFFDDTFLLFNAEILCNMDIDGFVRFHKERSADITIAVTRMSDPSGYDIIESDAGGYLRFSAAHAAAGGAKAGTVNAGVYVIEPALLSKIPNELKVTHVLDLCPTLICRGAKIAVYQGCSYWRDLCTPEQYLKAHAEILSGDIQISGVHFRSGNVFKDGNSDIDATAVINGPVYIGNNVKIGAYATIGPNAVIGDDVYVHLGGKVVGSVLWNNVDIGTCAKMDGSIVASDCKIRQKAAHTGVAFTKTRSVEWKRVEEKAELVTEA